LAAALAAEGVTLTRADLTATIGSWQVEPDLILLALDSTADRVASVAETRARELLADARFDDVPILLIAPGSTDATGGSDREAARLASGADATDEVLAFAQANADLRPGEGGDAGRLSRLLAAGAFDFLAPGFAIAVLRSRIEAALRWRRRMRGATEAASGRTGNESGLPSLPPVPLTQRSLRVSGAVLRGAERTGASFDVALDELGRLTLFAFDASWLPADAAMRSFAVRRAVREALDVGRPLDAVAADALATMRSLGPETLGLVALRFSADATTLELLNCGFAPVFELREDGSCLVLALASERLGAADSQRYSASMVSVNPGSLYIALSRSAPVTAKGANGVGHATSAPGATAPPPSPRERPQAWAEAAVRAVTVTLADGKPLAMASMTEADLRQAWGATHLANAESDLIVLLASSDPSHISSRP
jgi:hypothetical protein